MSRRSEVDAGGASLYLRPRDGGVFCWATDIQSFILGDESNLRIAGRALEGWT
jgi:hypothetical protein